MPWSKRQQLALALVPKVSSLLSLSGSAWILTEVVTDASKRKHPYHRLLLGMSVYDILESIWNFINTWAIPAGTQGVWHPRGSTATCTAQGFFLSLGIAVPIYNALLSLYYVMVINYNIPDTQIAQRAERLMHAIAFGWAFFTALYAAVKGLLNNANLWCWIAPLPGDCLDSRRHVAQGNCQRGDNAWIYRWVFYFAPLWFCIFFATVCTILVYRKVQKYDRITLKYRRPAVSLLGGQCRNDKSRDSWSLKVSRNASSSRMQNPPIQDYDDSTKGDQKETEEEVDSTYLSPKGGLEQIDEQEMDAYAEETNPARWDLPAAYHRWKLRRQMFRQVFQQAVWYLGVFYLTHVWSTTNRTIQLVHNGRAYYPLTVIHSFFDPLQGFLNFWVYQRPRYLRICKAYPEISRWGAFRKALEFTAYSGASDEWLQRRSGLVRSGSQWWRFSGRPSWSRGRLTGGEVAMVSLGRQERRISSVSGVSDLLDPEVSSTNLSVVAEASGDMPLEGPMPQEAPIDECEPQPDQEYESNSQRVGEVETPGDETVRQYRPEKSIESTGR